MRTTALFAALTVALPAFAQSTISAEDRDAIQALVGRYAQALSGCRAAEFADLFTPTGAFASGFRGRMVGRERLIALVESERQCTSPNTNKAPAAARPGGTAPVPTLTPSATGVSGLVSAGTAEYQDEYIKTPQGWRFASRTVVIAAEKAAGLDAPDMLAIQRLGGDKLGDHYEPDQTGVQRLMNSGVKITVTNGQVTGRAFFKDGTFKDEVYERVRPGVWRVKQPQENK